MTGGLVFTLATRALSYAVLSLLFAQGEDNRPLTNTQVKELFLLEQNRSFLRGTTRDLIEKHGVGEELDASTEQEFRRLGMDQSLLELIRRRARISTIVVQCLPVECQVAVNGVIAGTTVGGIFTKSSVTPGQVNVRVVSPNFEPQTTVVQVSAGQEVKVPPFKFESLKGGLDIVCEPNDCVVQVLGPNGFLKTSAPNNRLSVPGLASGRYEVEGAATGYKPERRSVAVVAPEIASLRFSLEMDSWNQLTPLEVFDRVVGSLGGKSILLGTPLSGTARMTLNGDHPSIGIWQSVQVREVSSPGRFNWDLTIAGTRWSLVLDGSRISAKGDKIYIGTQFAQEIEHSLRLFSTFRLPALLPLIRSGFDIKKDRIDKVMIAESAQDRYTFFLNQNYSPRKVLHERLTVPRSVEEIEFAQYRLVGEDLIVPHVMILRYPDRPKHTLVMEYDRIEPGGR